MITRRILFASLGLTLVATAAEAAKTTSIKKKTGSTKTAKTTKTPKSTKLAKAKTPKKVSPQS